MASPLRNLQVVNAPLSLPLPTRETVPADLLALQRWAPIRVIGHHPTTGKPNREPVNVHQGGPANFLKPETLTTFDHALAVAIEQNFPALWFALPDGMVAVDVDECVGSDGSVDKRGQKALAVFAYVEVSPSASGLRGFAYGTIPGNRKRDGVELSQSGFLSVTGRSIFGRKPSITVADPDALQDLWDRLAPPTISPATSTPPATLPLNITDDEMLRRMFEARNGDRLRRLWAGDLSDYGDDHSAADLAALTAAAFWTGPDHQRLADLFATSALADRDKWRNRTDYREKTIAKAISHRTGFYTWPQTSSAPSTASPAPRTAPTTTTPEAASQRGDYTDYAALRAELAAAKTQIADLDRIITERVMAEAEAIIAEAGRSYESALQERDARIANLETDLDAARDELYQVHRLARQPHLNPSEKLVTLAAGPVLARQAGRSDEPDGAIRFSAVKVAPSCGLSADTVNRSLRVIASTGVLTVRHESRRNGDGQTYQQTLLTLPETPTSPGEWLRIANHHLDANPPTRKARRPGPDGEPVPTTGRTHGGKRTCPKCGEVGKFCVSQKVTTQVACVDCGSLIGETTNTLPVITGTLNDLPAEAAKIVAAEHARLDQLDAEAPPCGGKMPPHSEVRSPSRQNAATLRTAGEDEGSTAGETADEADPPVDHPFSG